MLVKRNRDWLQFTFISLVITGLHLIFCSDNKEVIVLLVFYLATIINFILLTCSVKKLLTPSENIFKFKLVAIFLLKFVVLIVPIIWGIQLVGSRIMIALLNYILQIFVLGVYLRFRYLR